MGGFIAPFPIGQLNVALSQYAKGVAFDDCIADQVAPRVGVDREQFQYYIEDFAALQQVTPGTTLRAPGGRPAETRMALSTDTYHARSHAKTAAMPRESQRQTAGFGYDMQAAAARKVMREITLDREYALAQLLTSTARVANSVTLAGAQMWDSYLTGGSSDPVAVINLAKDSIKQVGVAANLLVLTPPVITALRDNPIIRAQIKYGDNRGPVTLNDLSILFEIPCVEAKAVMRDGNRVGHWAWGVSPVLLFTQPVANQMDMSAAKTFVWEGAPDTASAHDAGGYGVITFPDPYPDAKTDWCSVDMYYDLKITAQETIFLISGAVQQPVMQAIPAPPAIALQ